MASFWYDFGTFLRSDGLPGPPVRGLGLPWAPKVTPRRVPRGSGGGFLVDLGDPGGPWREILDQQVAVFVGAVLGELRRSLFHRFFFDFR